MNSTYKVKSFKSNSCKYEVDNIDLEMNQSKTVLLFEFEILVLNGNYFSPKEETIEILISNESKTKFEFKKFKTVIQLLEFYLKIIDEYNEQGFANEFIERYDKLILDLKPYY